MKQPTPNLAMLSLFLLSTEVFAAKPILELENKPNATISIKPNQIHYLYFTIKNNAPITLPLHYSSSSNVGNQLMNYPAGTTCTNQILSQQSCVIAFQYTGSNTNSQGNMHLEIDYRGRGPITSDITLNTNSALACDLLNTADANTSFCQSQYQNALLYTQNVFNISNTNVIEEQSLGGVLGFYQKLNNTETICYVSCGLRAINSTAPDQNTLFELASVSKTFTASILGKLIYNSTINSALDNISSYALPAGYAFNANEANVTFQQLATFSGGVCFSDAPSVNINSGDPTLNQTHFVQDINALNPNPASGNCADGATNVKPIYGSTNTPPFLPTQNRYSNSSFGLLGQSLMTIQGHNVFIEGYNDWLCDNVFNVLNMQSSNGCLPSVANNGTCPQTSCTFSAGWINSEYATGYHVSNHQFQQGNPFPYTPWAPAGGIRSNAVDMINYIRANLGFNLTNNAQELSLIQGMSIAHQPNQYLPAPGTSKANIGSQNPLLGGQGFAWVNMTIPGTSQNVLGKIGGHVNFRSFVGFNPSKNYGVVILLNTGALSTNGSIVPLAPPPSTGVIGYNLLSNL